MPLNRPAWLSSIQKNRSNRLRLLEIEPKKKTKHNGVFVVQQDGARESKQAETHSY